MSVHLIDIKRFPGAVQDPHSTYLWWDLGNTGHMWCYSEATGVWRLLADVALKHTPERAAIWAALRLST